jgi:hypothetical protein
MVSSHQKGLSMSEIQQQIHASYLSTLRTSIVIWPLASLINFYFISVEYRLFFTGGMYWYDLKIISSCEHSVECLSIFCEAQLDIKGTDPTGDSKSRYSGGIFSKQDLIISSKSFCNLDQPRE